MWVIDFVKWVLMVSAGFCFVCPKGGRSSFPCAALGEKKRESSAVCDTRDSFIIQYERRFHFGEKV